jgi:hypothetical protein
MKLAYALKAPPQLAIRPSATSVMSKDVFGLSHEHERHYKMILDHLCKTEVWHNCQELVPGEKFSFGGDLPVVSLEEYSGEFTFLEGIAVEFVLIAKSQGNHFLYRANFTLPWGLSPSDHLPEMIAAVLCGDRELQYEIEGTVAGGFAEMRKIQSIEVTTEWREI